MYSVIVYRAKFLAVLQDHFFHKIELLSTYLELRKPQTRTVSIGLIQASSSFTRTRGIALTRWTGTHFMQEKGMGNGKLRV